MTITTVDEATVARIRRLVDAFPAAREKRREISTKWDERIDQARAAGRNATASYLEFKWDREITRYHSYRRADRIRATLARLVYHVTGTAVPDFHKVDALEVPAVILRVDDRLVVAATSDEGSTVTVVNLSDVPTI
jgi:hypothetical protein